MKKPYKQITSLRFEVAGEEMECGQPDLNKDGSYSLDVGETRKNGQEDGHMVYDLYHGGKKGDKWVPVEEDTSYEDRHYDVSYGQVCAFLNKNDIFEPLNIEDFNRS